MTGIIIKPIITEKATKAQEKQQYTFQVDINANKIDIAREISKKFNVTVVDVRTMQYKPKTKTQLTRRGRFTGKTTSFKKAIVRLKEGEKIEIFENV